MSCLHACAQKMMATEGNKTLLGNASYTERQHEDRDACSCALVLFQKLNVQENSAED